MGYNSSKKTSIPPLGPSCRKTMYPSRQEAEEAIRYITETRYVRGLHVYLCESCGMWHLSSKSQ